MIDASYHKNMFSCVRNFQTFLHISFDIDFASTTSLKDVQVDGKIFFSAVFVREFPENIST